MRVLITGAKGQLGQALLMTAPVEIGNDILELIPLGRSELDLTKTQDCWDVVEHYRPDWIINAGAYTAVDLAESQSDLTFSINAAAPAVLAQAISAFGGRILQISTDFVFDGCKSTPYLTTDSVNPLSVYGSTKAEGEVAVLRELGAQGRAFVLRTSWVYNLCSKNFVTTMLRLHSERDSIKVVSDQVGSPTSAISLASACWRILQRQEQSNTNLPAIHHWRDSGVASWYDLAVAVGEVGHSLGLLDQPADVSPITTKDYPSTAIRPSYSVLDITQTSQDLQLSGSHWRKILVREMSKVVVHKD